MLDRVTPRTEMRDELITITRMLMGMPQAVKGDLPKPEAGAETEVEDAAAESVEVKKDAPADATK